MEVIASDSFLFLLLPSGNNNLRSFVCSLQLFVREIHKIIKGKAFKSSFNHIFKRRKLFSSEYLSVNKRFNLKIHKIDSCLNLVFLVLGCGVRHFNRRQIGIIRTFLTLKLFPAVFINQRLCFVKRRFRLGNLQIRTVDYLIHIQWCIQLCNKSLIYGFSVSVSIHIEA